MNKLHKKRMSDKSLNNLINQKPRWNNLPTKAIRVPEFIADELLEIAREKDSSSQICKNKKENNSKIHQAVGILRKSLKMPANKGGAIKKEIKEAIKLLSSY